MKKILIKSFLFVLLISVTLYPVLRFIAKNFSDRFYNKFTYQAPSLIVGSSVALFGLNPAKINNHNQIEKPFLNFAFTQATSPYGEVYYKAIMKKVKPEEKNGTFILEVSPLSLTSKNDSLPETSHILGRLLFFNSDPNIDYILKNNQHPLYLFFLKKKFVREDNKHIYNKDGWNENLNVPDSNEMPKIIEKSVLAYKKIYSKFSISEYRLDWLQKTIASLSSHGKVVLIRVPIGKEMVALQNVCYPEFNKTMKELADKNKIPYLDLSMTKNYNFIDGLHMAPASAKRFSVFLGDTLSKIRPE